jgi:hypothetical protein
MSVLTIDITKVKKLSLKEVRLSAPEVKLETIAPIQLYVDLIPEENKMLPIWHRTIIYVGLRMMG